MGTFFFTGPRRAGRAARDEMVCTNEIDKCTAPTDRTSVKLAFHDADTDTDTDILADFRARIVHEPDTHEDPRRLVRHAARFSSRGSSRVCPLWMSACTRVLYTISYCVHVYKITRQTHP